MVGRDRGERHRAGTPLELLFDLCFVVAVAQAGAQLHHSLAEGRFAHGLSGYAAAFFAIWWAWVNFTWFASAYDTDDVFYRLLTLLQIAGALVLAAGIPAAFERFDFATAVSGYVLMRLAMVTQWLRAAHDHPAGRPAALRYALGITVCQIGWVIRLTLPQSWGWISFMILAVAELLVPVWAEYRGTPTPWNASHIRERYGAFTLIVLGESVAAATVAVQSAITDHGTSAPLIVLAAGGLILVFALWWAYFDYEGAAVERVSLRSTMVWAYSHFGIFASMAAVGAGLQVVAQVSTHAVPIGPIGAAYAAAVPVAIFLLLAAGVHAWLGIRSPIGRRSLVAFAALVLLAPLAAGLVSPSGVILSIGLLMAAMVAVKVALTQRAATALPV